MLARNIAVRWKSEIECMSSKFNVIIRCICISIVYAFFGQEYVVIQNSSRHHRPRPNWSSDRPPSAAMGHDNRPPHLLE